MGRELSIMLIYKDIFIGDELFSDSFKVKEVDGVFYEVYGKHVSRTEGDVVLEGSNASAEEADEGTDSCTESGIDVILNHRLVETGFGSKKDYMVYMKDYMKKVVKYLEDNKRNDEVPAFKKNINDAMKEIFGKFKELKFYQGEGMDPNAMIMILDYKEVNGEEKPILMAFNHGVKKEKC